MKSILEKSAQRYLKVSIQNRLMTVNDDGTYTHRTKQLGTGARFAEAVRELGGEIILSLANTGTEDDPLFVTRATLPPAVERGIKKGDTVEVNVDTKVFDPWNQCPNCDSRRVYGNGPDAREIACPDCGMQYKPSNYLAEPA